MVRKKNAAYFLKFSYRSLNNIYHTTWFWSKNKKSDSFISTTQSCKNHLTRSTRKIIHQNFWIWKVWNFTVEFARSILKVEFPRKTLTQFSSNLSNWHILNIDPRDYAAGFKIKAKIQVWELNPLSRK